MRERVVDCWRLGDDGMAKWHQEKGDEFVEFADICEREVNKAFKGLCGDRSKES